MCGFFNHFCFAGVFFGSDLVTWSWRGHVKLMSKLAAAVCAPDKLTRDTETMVNKLPITSCFSRFQGYNVVLIYVHCLFYITQSVRLQTHLKKTSGLKFIFYLRSTREAMNSKPPPL